MTQRGHTTRDAYESGGKEWEPRILVGLGYLFVLVIVGEWVLLDVFGPGENLASDYSFTLLFNGVPALGISYGGYWLARSGVEPDQYRRVLRWCLGGLAAFLLLNLLMIAVWPAPGFRTNLGWARGTAIFGALGGFLVGAIEARTVLRARVAEREIARTKHLETQRQWLGYMNSLLRHEVLNTANVIEGYSDLLIDDDPDELTADRLKVIRRQSRNLSDVINDVRVLLEATEEADELAPVNLSEVVTERLVELRTRDADADVEASVPADVYVAADELLPRVFSNLLNNAVEHNDGPDPAVSVSVETTEDTAVVTVADNGPGVPPKKRDSLFEGDVRTSNHGLGLYLVRTLADRYGGTVELRETGPAGSAFVVELPRVPNPSAERSEDASAPDPTPIAASSG